MQVTFKFTMYSYVICNTLLVHHSAWLINILYFTFKSQVMSDKAHKFKVINYNDHHRGLIQQMILVHMTCITYLCSDVNFKITNNIS